MHILACTFIAGAALLCVPMAAAVAASPQPTVPPPDSPVVEQLARSTAPHGAGKPPKHQPAAHHRHRVAGWRVPRFVDRPALAGVELLEPLPPPGEPPHIIVPVPAYPLESIAASLTSPPPPVMCHRVPRDLDAPDPRLYREVPVRCEPDNP
jgi:hypothetical protein